MKYAHPYTSLLVLLMHFIVMLSCESSRSSIEGYLISAEISGIEDGVAELAKIDLASNEKVIVDSAVIRNGKFIFQGCVESPYLHTIFMNDSIGKIHLFLENSEFAINGSIDQLDKIVVEGSREDSLFRSYPIDAIFERKTGMAIMMDHPTYTYSAFVAYYQFQIHNIQLDSMEFIINSFAQPVKESAYYKHLENLYQTIKRVAISQPAPDFSLPDTHGDSISFSSFRGKYVLIDFWASWCAPCRASNPSLVKMYGLFEERNFTISGVSVDTNRDRWLEAISKDGLQWTNLSGLDGWNSVAQLYGVKAVPQNFLIDPDGIIIDKNIDIDRMIERLNEVLPDK